MQALTLRRLVLAQLLLFAAGVRCAPVDNTCRNGGFSEQQGKFGLAKVVGAGRLYLLDDMDGCPQSGAASCTQKAYVIPGDTVMTGRTAGRYVCVLFHGKEDSAGWVDASRVTRLVVNEEPEPDAWLGHWSQGDNEVVITQKGDRLSGGKAYWPDANPPEDSFPGGANSGGFAATAKPAGNAVVFQDDGCEVTAYLIGRYLVVNDNAQCGSMNVRFAGIYQRGR